MLSEFLHKYFYGAQDKHIEEVFPKEKHIYEGEFISTETYCLESNEDISKPSVINLTYGNCELTNSDCVMASYGYSNIQLNDKYCDMVIKICIIVDGNRINTIYPSTTGATRIFDFADGNTILPETIYNKIKIMVYFKSMGTIELSVDKMKITNPVKSASVMIQQVQHNGDENISNKSVNKIRLNYNHPIRKITIIASDDVQYNTTLKMKLSDHSYYETTMSSCNKKCVYEFGNTINFSRIDDSHLLVETSHPTTLHIFAETLHIMRINNGMIGLAFSK